MVQYKHDIRVNQKFDISEIGNWWWKRKNISLSWNKANYNSPTIIKYKSMIIDIPNDQMFLHNETNNNNNNESMRTMLESLTNGQLKIFYQKIEYLIHCILLYVIIYITTSRTRMKYQNILLVCYSKWVIWLITRQIKVLFYLDYLNRQNNLKNVFLIRKKVPI